MELVLTDNTSRWLPSNNVMLIVLAAKTVKSQQLVARLQLLRRPIYEIQNKRSAVATSTVEAENLSLGTAGQESVWLGRMFAFAIGAHNNPTNFRLIGNQEAIVMAMNDASYTQTKHIDIKNHFVRDLVYKKKVTFE